MKTGVVLDIKDKKATVMQAGGNIISLHAKSEWQKGDVITVHKRRINYKSLSAIAACLVLLFIGSFSGYQAYTTETALISLDINPSLELKLNKYGNVIGIEGYNDEGSMIADTSSMKGDTYEDALRSLLTDDDFVDYLKNNELIEVFVYSSKDEKSIKKNVNSILQELLAEYSQLELSLNTADQAFVTDAHNHGMTPGKYSAFLELQELDPNINAKDYHGCGINEIHNQINQHHAENASTEHSSSGSTQNHDSGHNGVTNSGSSTNSGGSSHSSSSSNSSHSGNSTSGSSGNSNSSGSSGSSNHNDDSKHNNSGHSSGSDHE